MRKCLSWSCTVLLINCYLILGLRSGWGTSSHVKYLRLRIRPHRNSIKLTDLVAPRWLGALSRDNDCLAFTVTGFPMFPVRPCADSQARCFSDTHVHPVQQLKVRRFASGVSPIPEQGSLSDG
jgi:hypothetical protein